MQGAVAGSPGTSPTNWSITTGGGVTRTIVGTGTEGGIDYIDVRLQAASAISAFIIFESNTSMAALSGQTWTGSAFVKLVGGSLTNLSPKVGIEERSNVGAFLVQTVSNITPTSASLGTQRNTVTRVFNNAATAFANCSMTLAPTGAYDVTFRVGFPQAEQGLWASSPIRTTSAAATRAADVVTVTTVPSVGSAFSLFAKATPQAPITYINNQGALSIDDGTTSNRGSVLRNGSTGVGGATLVGGGVTQWSGSSTVVQAQNLSGRYAAAFATASLAAAFNGSIITNDSGSIPTGLTQVHIGSRADRTLQFNGYIERATIWPTTRLTNAILSRITQ